MKTIYYGLPFFFLFVSCETVNKEQQISQWKKELSDTEAAFAKMVGDEGIHKAFTSFAADNAVLMRNDQLIQGINNIDEYYKSNTTKGLHWTPEYVDVSQSGDMGYTFGYYTFTYLDSLGIKAQSKGVFHTVWKRQSDGTWKFVWD